MPAIPQALKHTAGERLAQQTAFFVTPEQNNPKEELKGEHKAAQPEQEVPSYHQQLKASISLGVLSKIPLSAEPQKFHSGLTLPSNID